MRLLASLACLVVLALQPSCGGCTSCDTEPPPGDGPPTMASTFLLEDVNSTSASFQQLVSPRLHLGRISAWYFGRST